MAFIFNFFRTKPKAGGLVDIKLKTDGMHCSSCAVNIDLALEELTGVTNSKTNFARSETKVEYDPKIVKTQTIKKVVEDLGYKVVSAD